MSRLPNMVGDEITVEATELVAGGDALARVDGLPIFVANIYPGDVARVRVTEVKKGFARAELVQIERPSELRRAMPCPIADECGGCDWTSLRLDAQLAAKQRILRESLRRVGKINEHPEIVVHPSPLNYRLRSRLHRDGDAVGFYATGSHRVVPLARECEVVGVETREQPREGELWEVDGQLIDHGELTILGYQLSTDNFFQVNRHLLQTMLDRVTGIAKRCSGSTAIDLYAGVGFFSVPLAKQFERVIAVEGSRESCAYARRNVPPNVQVINKPVESFDVPKADFIFLDPPRSGAKKSVIDAVSKQARAMICFLACDPVTFARDASRLTASGWRLASLDLLDLFPNTHHVETLASFERAR